MKQDKRKLTKTIQTLLILIKSKDDVCNIEKEKVGD